MFVFKTWPMFVWCLQKLYNKISEHMGESNVSKLKNIRSKNEMVIKTKLLGWNFCDSERVKIQGIAWEREEAKGRTHEAAILPPYFHLKLCLLHCSQLSVPLHILYLYCLLYLEELHHCPTDRFGVLWARHRLVRVRLVHSCWVLGQSTGHAWLCHYQRLSWVFHHCLCYAPHHILV